MNRLQEQQSDNVTYVTDCFLRLDKLTQDRHCALEKLIQQQGSAIEALNKKCESLERCNEQLRQELNFQSHQLDTLDNRGRCYNVMFIGIPREEGETQQSCENKVRQLVGDAIDNVNDGIDQVLRVSDAIVVKFKSLKHKKPVLAHSTSLRQQKVSVREDYSDMVRQTWSLMKQSMQQNGKRATLRCDKLFTDEGVYTYDTSNNSVVKLSPKRSWAPLCTAPKMDEVMSDDDTQWLQGERKKE